MSVIGRFNSLSTRAKAITVIALMIVTPVAAWAGYQFGYWLGHN